VEHDAVVLVWKVVDIIFNGEIIMALKQIHEIKEIFQIMNIQQNIHINEQEIGNDIHLLIIIEYG
jgi:hypothetical protein